jgi:hypothetical protein
MNFRLFLVAFVLWGCACLAQIGPVPTIAPVFPQEPLAVGTFLQGGGGSNATTFAGVNFGTADATRYIIVVGYVVSSQAFGSITIAGTTATNITNSTDGISQLRIGVAAVPAGTSGTIVLNYSTPGTAFYSAYSLVKSARGTSGTGTSGSAVPFSATPTVPTGGFVIGASGDAANVTRTWTNVTQDTNQVVSTSSLTTASRQFRGSTNTTAFSVNWSSNTPIAGFAEFFP